MEDFIERYVAYLEGYTWHIACSCLVLFLFVEHYLGGCTYGDGPLAILGFDHALSCGVLHVLSTLHIHPWNWLTWDLHMWIGYMHLVDHLLFLEVDYGAFS
jgi:hypothetical protein